jgi:phage terminase large subunit GpA-like protein
MNFHQSIYLVAGRVYERFRPPPKLTNSEWADEKFYLSPESSAEPGKWKTYSYQREPLDAMSDPFIEVVTVKKSARVGYTKWLNIDTGYNIEQTPCPQLTVQPTIDDAQGYSKDEIAVMLRDTPCLYGLVAEAKSRDSNNTILKKHFPGGSLTLIGANSARGFRRITVRVVRLDEVDAYPLNAGKEGDQILLAIKRTETFWNRKIIIGSTPVLKGQSRVDEWFKKSDQRYYMVPCPTCGGFQRLKFANMKWPKGNPERAYFICEHCKKEIDHKQKRSMVDAGRWEAKKPFNGNAGFHIWAAYSFSPGAAWGKIATRFVEAKRHFTDTGDSSKLQTVINTDFGECWEERGDGVETVEVQSRKDEYSIDEIPNDVLVITAGADVQGGKQARVEIELVGWGVGSESWSLDYIIIPGDPERNDVWIQLDEILLNTYRRGDGVPLRVNCACIDSGFATNAVYSFVRNRQVRRVFATKGASTPGLPIVGRPSKKSVRNNIILYPVGTDTAKDQIASFLKTDKPGAPGYCHFPDHYPDEYFAQLTAEQAITRYRKGVPYRAWVQTRKRNEALDCRVNATAAREILNPQYRVIKKKLVAKAERLRSEEQGADKPKPQIKLSRRPIRRRPRKNFVNNY